MASSTKTHFNPILNSVNRKSPQNTKITTKSIEKSFKKAIEIGKKCLQDFPGEW